MDELDVIKNKITSKAYAAMLDIKYLCENLESKYYDEQTNLVRASYKLASAKANISCAEAIYFAHYDILQKSYLDELFFKFDRLLDEIVRDVHTDHSKQYVYDYADDLVEHFNDSDFCCDGYKIEIVYKDE